MARVPLIVDKSQLAHEHHEIYESISATRGAVAGPFAVLLHDPPLAARIAHLGSHVRFESALSARDRELVILAVAAEMDCEYERHFHVPLARQAGVSEDVIAAIRARAELAGVDGQVAAYVRQLLRSRKVDDRLFDALLSRFGPHTLVTLTATIGYYAMLACVLNAFDVRPPSVSPP